jgi:hypothetical protein
MVIGAKKIETRAWSTDYRGPLAIHAGKRLVFPDDPKFRNALDDLKIDLDTLPLGAVLGVCQLVSIYRIPNLLIQPRHELIFGDYTPGRYAWLTRNMIRFEAPVPFRGKQGLWNWLPELTAALEILGSAKN